MTVDPALLGMLAALPADGTAFDLDSARRAVQEYGALVAPARGDARDELLDGVPVRHYEAPGDGPLLLWLHGGGWVTGGLDAVDPLCRTLLARTGGPLVSVDYRLAPEAPFPAAVDDAVAVLRAAAARGPVVVGGDSVGGGLAAAACQAVRGEGLPVRAQLLLGPLLDCTLTSASTTALGEGYGLTRRALEQLVALYLQGADPRDPRCSPLLADDLSGLPPAVVVTAELDPLRDEGEAYATRLAAAGVPVAVRRFDAMVHGFHALSALTPVADEALDWAFGALADLLDG